MTLISKREELPSIICQEGSRVVRSRAHDTTLEMAVDGSITYNQSGFEPLQGPISPRPERPRRAALPSAHEKRPVQTCVQAFSTPKGIRTPVTGLRTRGPRPLDDGGGTKPIGENLCRYRQKTSAQLRSLNVTGQGHFVNTVPPFRLPTFSRKALETKGLQPAPPHQK